MIKKFREYINEDTLPKAIQESCLSKGYVGIDNGPVRDNINMLLAQATKHCTPTPYHALEAVRKVLAASHIFLPQTNFLEGGHGYEVFPINQFGDKFGMKNNGEVVTKVDGDYFLYFEYTLNDYGSFDIFSELVDNEELQELISDTEKEDEEEEESEDASETYDSYKSDNQEKEPHNFTQTPDTNFPKKIDESSHLDRIKRGAESGYEKAHKIAKAAFNKEKAKKKKLKEKLDEMWGDKIPKSERPGFAKDPSDGKWKPSQRIKKKLKEEGEVDKGYLSRLQRQVNRGADIDLSRGELPKDWEKGEKKHKEAVKRLKRIKLRKKK